MLSWHTSTVEKVISELKTSLSSGLSQVEASRRLGQNGPNALLMERRRRWYHVFGRQFTSVLIIILYAAAGLALLVGDVKDAITILAIVAINGVLGFAQEWKAEKAIEALKKMLSPRCKVMRDGHERVIDARDLVPGDIVVLELGDHVPADLRLSEALNLKTDEAVLTGESQSVHKEVTAVAPDTHLAGRTSMAWMGTTVTNGRARGVVVTTGMETEFGRIARLTQEIGEEQTPLQRKLALLGKQLGVASILIAAAVALMGWLLGKPIMEMVMTGVSLAVAVVPEGLPAVVTVTLALGIRAMVRHRALLRRLQAAETLGSATVICADKTGTMTKNEMTVQKIWLPKGPLQVTGIGYDPSGHFEFHGRKVDYRERPDLLALLTSGLICNNARLFKSEEGWDQLGEPTEAALVVAAYKAWLSPNKELQMETEFSFNSMRKRMTIVEKDELGMLAHVKGAPEIILERCSRILDGATERDITDADRKAFHEAYQEMAGSGLRTLAIARRRLPESVPLDEDAVEKDLTLLGVVGIIDPPRSEVRHAVNVAHRAGIRPIMITGDAPATALAIARQVGMHVERAITGHEIEAMDDTALMKVLTRPVLFARTTPEHKLRIVRLLQADREVVGMTGDGVNDAPALKQADIGIAMGSRGTDVARGASDIVLTDDNFASIIEAVGEGRRQYDNIKKFVRYLLSSNTGEVLAIFVNILVGGPLILLPVQILWMNLVTDGMTAVALGMGPAEKGVMRQPPRSKGEHILDWRGTVLILGLGGYIAAGTLWLFQHYLASADAQQMAQAQTIAFTGIIILEKMNVFNFNSLREPMFVVGIFSNPWVLLALVLTIGMQVGAVYIPFMQTALHTVPIALETWGLMLLVAFPIFLITEIFKWLRWRRRSYA